MDAQGEEGAGVEAAQSSLGHSGTRSEPGTQAVNTSLPLPSDSAPGPRIAPPGRPG